MFTTPTRRLFLSRMMRKPLTYMKQKVDQALGISQTSTKLKYMVYSAHDD